MWDFPMKKKIEIRTVAAKNIFPSESLEFVKQVLEKYYNCPIESKAKEIHRQDKPQEYTDEIRIYGSKEKGIRYHSHIKVLEQESTKTSIATICCEVFGFPDLELRFSVSSENGLLLEFDLPDNELADKILELFEDSYGHCR
jgi:hypothetical protein